jgi:amino acid adenylation domain-containing protein
MSNLQERIAGLSPEQRELLLRKLRERGIATSHLPIIARKRDAKHAPLSFAQQRLWFLAQLEPDSFFYNIFDIISFDRPLNIKALEQSLNQIVRRHEILRTTFRVVDEQPMQVIAPDLSLPLRVIDLSALAPLERDEEVARLSTEEARRPFDLSGGPLLRATLLQPSDEEQVLMLSMHHIISDAWSLDIFSRELQMLYGAFSKGDPSPLPELPIQYADFAVWQREWMQGEALEEQMGYWVKQLAGAPSALELPTAYPRPLVPTYSGATQSHYLSESVANSLRELSRQEGATLFMTMLAAFNVLLHRYTHQTDILVGTPLAGRNRMETEGLIGFFVNTLVLRTDLSGDPSFRELLGRVREVSLGAYAHQDLPFEKLVEVVQPERDTSRNPLFQVSFQLSSVSSSAGGASREAEEAANESQVEVEKGAAKFDLEVNIWESKRGLRVQMDYSTDLFDDASIARMLNHFEILLEEIVQAPNLPVSRLPMLTEEERDRILTDWNDTATDYPRYSCLPDLFESQVERTPERIAVSFAGQELTYTELNERSNQVARRLRQLGIGPEIFVGICMERSIELIVGILGILKAGGAYMPLDPQYPAQRLSYMVEDAGVSVLLTEQRLAEMLPADTVRVVCLDAEWESIIEESVDNLEHLAAAENPAYVIYTSGSTGMPKGVVITHKAVARTVCNSNYIKFEQDDRVAQVSNSSFDAATFEIWGALLHGAALVVVPKDAMLLPRHFAEQLLELGISVMFLTTALFNQVAGEVPEAFSSLRCLLFGGDAADPRWVREVLKSDPPRALLNAYGPTESTTFAAWHRAENLSPDSLNLPIGRPLSNSQLYILNEHREPVPVGVKGELYIGGDGLARGYLNRPALTAERFIPNPFCRDCGERMYRTGDEARHLASGEIEFLGRRDGQVKIRGYRIELGEIEASLREQAEVRAAVVLAREDMPDEKRLVAYVVANQANEFSVSELRRTMSERLPDYMLPSAFVFLDRLPLTPNGKVDRRALPCPEQVMQEEEKDFASPRTPVEEMIADIYASVLHLKSVGVNDNFFELGGHSLLATQIISRIRETFKVELPLRTLFVNPTVTGLAASVGAELNSEIEPHAPAINRVSREQYRAKVSSAGLLEVPEALKSSMGMSKP